MFGRRKTPNSAIQHKDGPVARPALCRGRLCKRHPKSRVPGDRLLSQPSPASPPFYWGLITSPTLVLASTGSLAAPGHGCSRVAGDLRAPAPAQHPPLPDGYPRASPPKVTPGRQRGQKPLWGAGRCCPTGSGVVGCFAS